MTKIKEELQEIFRDIFDDETIELTDELNANDIEDWDSLSQIRLVVAIEKHFKIKLVFDELKGLENVGDMIKIIVSKVN